MDDMREEMPMDTAEPDNRNNTLNSQQGLAYCPVCGEPKEESFPAELLRLFPGFGSRTHHRKCACERAKDEQEQRERLQREHAQKVRHLLERCFRGNHTMRNMTFEASTSDNPAVAECRKYVAEWEAMSANNMGMIFWGDVGTGKSYMAASIANALIEQEVSVLMINLGDVMNATFETREELMKMVKQCSLLIIDDFGMERETDFGMEITFQVIDARYQSRKPLIITTNRSMNTLTAPKDLIHKRIYDRVLEMCPEHVLFKGQSIRAGIREQKRERFREIMSE